MFKKYRDYRLRKFCVKYAEATGLISKYDSVISLYSFIKDKVYQDPLEREAIERGQKI
jgi:hypothetical protein